MNSQHSDVRMVAKQSKNALDRIEALEKQVAAIVNSFNDVLKKLDRVVADQGEVLGATVTLLGQAEVEAKMRELRAEAKQKQVEEDKAFVAARVADGSFVPVTVIGLKSFIVGLETPGDNRIQTPFENVVLDLKEKLLGQGLGFELTLPNGNTFKITEIYEIVPFKPADDKDEVGDGNEDS